MALAAAGNSTYKQRLGAVVVAGGRVRGVGWSKGKNHARFVSDRHMTKCSVHAEEDALHGLTDLRRATIFVARLGANGTSVLAKPCSRCELQLAERGVTTVFWTENDGTIGWTRL